MEGDKEEMSLEELESRPKLAHQFRLSTGAVQGVGLSLHNATLLPEKRSYSETLYLIFNDPRSGSISFVISVCIFILIILSSISFMVATLPRYRYPQYGNQEGDTPPIFSILEDLCIIAFTVEYVVRLMTVPGVSWQILTEDVECKQNNNAPLACMYKIKNFILKPFNVIDLVAILPYYIGKLSNEQEASSFAILRILRLARVFRIFKLGKHSRDFHVYSEVLISCIGALSLMFFFTILTATVFGCFMYYLERGEWSDEHQGYLRPKAFGTGKELSPFESIPMSMWWVFVTTTTVGYGEIYPTTTFGRIIAVFTMNLGILGIALPITVIGQKFADAFAQEEAIKQTNTLPFDSDNEYEIKDVLKDMEQSMRELRKLINLQTEIIHQLRAKQSHDTNACETKSDFVFEKK